MLFHLEIIPIQKLIYPIIRTVYINKLTVSGVKCGQSFQNVIDPTISHGILKNIPITKGMNKNPAANITNEDFDPAFTIIPSKISNITINPLTPLTINHVDKSIILLSHEISSL